MFLRENSEHWGVVAGFVGNNVQAMFALLGSYLHQGQITK